MAKGNGKNGNGQNGNGARDGSADEGTTSNGANGFRAGRGAARTQGVAVAEPDRAPPRSWCRRAA
jgi:hypothetical protein